MVMRATLVGLGANFALQALRRTAFLEVRNLQGVTGRYSCAQNALKFRRKSLKGAENG